MNAKKYIAIMTAVLAAAASAAYAPAAFADETADTSSETVTESYTSVHSLSNPAATDEAKRLYDYICDNFGEYMISGQQESTWMGSADYEMDYISETTGKLPALRGLDFMNNDFNGVVKRGIEWDANGGIVEICWHCGVNGKGYNEALADDPDFDKLLTPGTDEYNEMLASWDKAGAALAKLQDAGVPVLWRPFHEFDGMWFWWGKGGAENFKKLWQMMYDHYTNDLGLNNLIWVLGYADDVKSGWYPGDEYCDVIGSDTYRGVTDNAKGWELLLKNAADTKPMAFHECGTLPSLDKFIEDEVIWSWFMVWHTDHIMNNDKENLTEVYNSDLVITLDELPDLKAYESDLIPDDSSLPEESSSVDSTSSAEESSVTDSSSTADSSSSSDSSSTASTVNNTSTASKTTATTTTTTTTKTSTDASPATGEKGIAASVVALLTAASIVISKKID